MIKEHFIITTLIIGIVTALPQNENAFEDSPKLMCKPAAGISNPASKLASQSNCGIRKAPRFRIVGGSDSQLGAWPWMVALGYKDLHKNNDSIKWLCSGTLISNTHVLTAHTCVANTGNKVLAMARLGELDLDPTIDDGATPLDVPIKHIIKYKEHNNQDYTNDIALLVLKNIITFNELIQPICLPDIKNIDIGNGLPFIAGWGATQFQDRNKSTSLKEAQIPITNIRDCKKAYTAEKAVIDDRTICAGEGGKDACTGDAGGPLMWFKEKQFYLIGIVSFGKKCGDPNYPGVYTRVSSYLDWILDNISN